jgi:hypothetical protein
MNVAGGGKSANVFLVDDERGTHDSTDQPTMQLRMLGELPAISSSELIDTIAEDSAGGKVDQLHVIGIDCDKGINVSGIVCIKLRLSQFSARM